MSIDRKLGHVSQEQKPNMMRGIDVYADPWTEMAIRNRVRLILERALPKDWVETRAQMVRSFGPGTVDAVARAYYVAGEQQ